MGQQPSAEQFAERLVADCVAKGGTEVACQCQLHGGTYHANWAAFKASPIGALAPAQDPRVLPEASASSSRRH